MLANIGSFGRNLSGPAILFVFVLVACGGGGSPSFVPKIDISPSVLNIAGLGTTFSQSFAVTESGYDGSFSIQSTASSCLNGSGSAAASVTPQSGGPATPFVVTASSVGTCTIVVSDATGATATVSVTVAETIITPQ